MYDMQGRKGVGWGSVCFLVGFFLTCLVSRKGVILGQDS